ncbi:PQQ-like beta-propeller repeat protein [Kribbella sp. NBC_01505]|uniref:outer membrane protein assembly factor BamB family protein n=1 Tax=Kribbella sp. NBC_01505 TaxID=2903580 RepID=UPI0038694D2B
MRGADSKRRIIFTAIGTGVVLIVTAGVVFGRPLWADRCAASFPKVPGGDLANFHAVPLDQVKVDDFPQEYRENARNFLEVAQHPLAPLGTARNAVVVPHLNENAAVLANSSDGNVRFEVGGEGLIGKTTYAAIVQLDGATGKPVWGRRQVGYNASGGDPADRMVLTYNPTDKALRVAAVDTGNGSLAWCGKVGADRESDSVPASDWVTSGDEMFVVRQSAPDEDVRLSRLDTRSGKVDWETPVAGLTEAGSVRVLNDQLLLSPFGGAMNASRRSRILDPKYSSQPVGDRGAVVARSVADGSATWSYRGPDERGWISNVVATGKDVAVVMSRGASSEGWLAGIDRTGKQLWKQEFKNPFDDLLGGPVKVAGDVVLSHEKGTSKGSSSLVARNLADGTERWRTQLTTTGSPLRSGASEVLGNTLVANTYDDGLIAIDLTSGAVTNPLPGKKIGPVDRIVSDNRTVTIDANGLFITFNRQTAG